MSYMPETMQNLRPTPDWTAAMKAQDIAEKDRSSFADFVAFCLALALIFAALGIWIFPAPYGYMLLIKLLASIALMSLGALIWLRGHILRRRARQP